MEPQNIALSLIVPVYNRPGEVEELLMSLTQQSDPDFEVIIVEDGSEQRCDEVVGQFTDRLKLNYHFKSNSGPGLSRNYGSERMNGNYCVFLDSDCVLPPHYVEVVRRALMADYVDAFGGPDRAHVNFTKTQKAINYAMTSFLTTGGIRGGGEALDKFYPRSFNMGYSREVFEKTGGFAEMRFGEDIDMSIRILKNGFRTRLIKDAYVYHKRRANLRQFFKQVHNSGIARINLYKRHPESLKAVHTLPALFVLGVVLILLQSLFVSISYMLPLLIYALLLFTDATLQNRSTDIGLRAVAAGFIQLTGYGSGFLRAFWKRIVLGRGEFSAFVRNFYK